MATIRDARLASAALVAVHAGLALAAAVAIAIAAP
jgi:hypothetical protein